MTKPKTVLSLTAPLRLTILDYVTGCKYYCIKLWDSRLGEYKEVFIDGWLKARLFENKTPWPRGMWDVCFECNKTGCRCDK